MHRSNSVLAVYPMSDGQIPASDVSVLIVTREQTRFSFFMAKTEKKRRKKKAKMHSPFLKDCRWGTHALSAEKGTRLKRLVFQKRDTLE